MSDRIRAHYGNRYVVQGRWAHLSKPKPIHLQQGRGTCQARNLCMRGCPYGGYFSSNSSTLPWAAKTGNLTMRPDSVVHSIIYDEARTAGDRRARDRREHPRGAPSISARVVFVNASALNTILDPAQLDLERDFPHGLGNDSGLLGKYVASPQLSRRRRTARSTASRTSTSTAAIPPNASSSNFRNLGKQETDFVGGYTTFTGAYRERGEPTTERVGGAYKDAQAQPGPWGIYMYMQGETIPKESNHVRLHETQKDQWGFRCWSRRWATTTTTRR